MRAAFYRRTGPAAEVLHLGDVADPEPGPGEVLVRVRASGINPADTKRRGGWLGVAMSHPLVIPHCDGAGEIVGTGAGVPADRIGERVWLWNAQGGYGTAGRAFGTAAELIALPAEQAVTLPDGVSFEAGACLGVPAVTAHRAVFADGPVAGQTILVHGAGGAVAHLAVQFAVQAGARVFGTAGSPARADHARAAGAEPVIDRHREDVIARVRDLTGGIGVDRIVEVDFGANLAADAAMLRLNGTIASYSSTSRPEPVLPYYAFAQKGANVRFIQGFAVPEAERRRAEADIRAGLVSGRLRPAIGAALPLAAIAEAHRLVEAGGTVGTVVVLP
jgi:NADPH:quinone reductase-like Zn-dependent oxidoreductase